MKERKKDVHAWIEFLVIPVLIAVVLCVCIGAFFLAVKRIDAKHEEMKPQVRELAEAYIADQYPGNDFEITALYHNFIDNSFEVKLQSQSSTDTYFKLIYKDRTLELEYDTYNDSVTGRSNTERRIVSDYAEQAKAVLEALPGYQNVLAEFVTYSEHSSGGGRWSPMGLDKSTLELDGVYDAAEMGWDYGYLEVRILEDQENLHIERLLERLWEMDAAMTQAGVGYQVVEIILVSDPDYTVAEEFYIHSIYREDLYSEDPMAVLQALWDKQEAKRQEIKEEWSK